MNPQSMVNELFAKELDEQKKRYQELYDNYVVLKDIVSKHIDHIADLRDKINPLKEKIQ